MSQQACFTKTTPVSNLITTDSLEGFTKISWRSVQAWTTTKDSPRYSCRCWPSSSPSTRKRVLRVDPLPRKASFSPQPLYKPRMSLGLTDFCGSFYFEGNASILRYQHVWKTRYVGGGDGYNDMFGIIIYRCSASICIERTHFEEG